MAGTYGSAYRRKTFKNVNENFTQIEAKKFARWNKSLLSGKDTHHTKAHQYKKLFRFSTVKSRGSMAVRRAINMRYINPGKSHPLDSKYAHFAAKYKIPVPHLSRTGRPKKFIGVIGTSRYLSRASWGKARSEFLFRKVVKPRVHRFKHVSHWRRRGNVVVAE